MTNDPPPSSDGVSFALALPATKSVATFSRAPSSGQAYWDNFAANVLGPNIQPIALRGKETYDGRKIKPGPEADCETTSPCLNVSSLELETIQLYADCLQPTKSIKMDDVRQGPAGDLYFDAALAAVAGRQPALIGESIKENDDGSYTVTFKGDQLHPVTVAKPSAVELLRSYKGDDDCFWPVVMEKAYTAHQYLYADSQASFNFDEDLRCRSQIARAVYLLTGAPHVIEDRADADKTFGQSDDYAHRLSQAMSDLTMAAALGHYALVGTGACASTQDNQLLPCHAYTVLAYSPGPDGGQFLMRNPQGNSQVPNGEYFSISANALAHSIEIVAVVPVRD